MDKEDLSIARPSFKLTQKITDFFSVFVLLFNPLSFDRSFSINSD